MGRLREPCGAGGRARSRRGLVASVGALGLALAAAGCGGDESSAPDRPVADKVPPRLQGVWERDVTPADIRRAAGSTSPPTADLPTGRAEVTFTKDGRVRFLLVDGGTVTSRVEVSGDELTIVDERELDFHCPRAKGEAGSYRWKATAERLTISAIADGCGDRAATFGGVWKRIG